MNLIEKYGSYDAAKAKQQELSKIAADPQVLLVGKIIKEIGEIEKALLKYRRQHNIYEVGDLVIDTNYKDSDIQEIKSVNGNKIEVFHKNKAYYFATYIFSFRHATDAEIAAGRRL